MTAQTGEKSGPLTGVRIIELAGLGLGPFTAMLLADLGANVIRVERGSLQPAPAPRFSRLPGALTIRPPVPGSDTWPALSAWGIDDVDALIASGAASQT